MQVGVPLYPLDRRVVFVRRAMSSLRSPPLLKIRTRDMDVEYPGWEGKEGEVTHYLLDYQSKIILFYRVPTIDRLPVIQLQVVRLPMKEMTQETHCPEIHESYHRDLRHWMVRIAYTKPDEDTYRPDKAKIAEARFTEVFGRESTAQDEAWIVANHGYDGDEGIF